MSAKSHISRRQLLGSVTTAAVVGAAGTRVVQSATQEKNVQQVVKNKRIRQSVVQWCFGEHWSVEETIEIAHKLGCGSVELLDPKYFPQLKKKGLECAIAGIDIGGPPFVKGYNNPKHHELVINATKKSINACKQFGFKRVIAFTGMAEGLTKEQGAKNCVDGFKKVVGYAEKNGVTLCLEMLNTRDDTHPMKGHPGYQGDDTEYCIDIIKKVGSEHLKLLFDIYHVQIMNGDVIRRIKQHKDYIAHVHTAGNPGRGELDQAQEIAYPAIMKTLLDVGYKGFVGQEFIPTRDPLKGLSEAVALCDV